MGNDRNNSVQETFPQGLLAVIGEKARKQIINDAAPVDLVDGEVLFRQGEMGSCAYAVLDGELDVMVDVGFDCVKTATVGPGGLIGEISIFTESTRTATVVARGLVRLLRIESSHMLDILEQNPSVARAVIADLGRRLVSVNQPLAFLSVAAQALQRKDFSGDVLNDMIANAPDLGSFAQTFKEIMGQVQSNNVRDQEMQMATQIQRSVLPKPLPDHVARHVDLDAFMCPMKEVGGDLYDYFAIDDTHLAVVIADVSGKGVPASLFMMMCRTVIRSVAASGLSVDQCMARANALLNEGNELAMFVTTFLGILALETGEFVYCNGGHNRPYVITAGGELDVLKTTGPLVAIIPTARYKSASMVLNPGDLLFMFTDGITEARAADDSLYGDDRLQELLAGLRGRSPAEVIAAVVSSVDSFAAGMEQADDITCLALIRRTDLG
ncbi:PP2C family protein-serine/threonine phosphatase [Magnetospirillum moscoviense]|uniref:Cyclic nucleotide-binding domain-containing protein n=1 Tax=Magnetospirillum moscoviense TaxID=1437059 RepID=A0A178MZQ8_9PROT|nr:SpoIIE family protein phosphatase [Magnetospirillum moscoviense]OAN64906.1 hypothetical protein A6A05_18880 [Magnetospirillum moscoviense]